MLKRDLETGKFIIKALVEIFFRVQILAAQILLRVAASQFVKFTQLGYNTIDSFELGLVLCLHEATIPSATSNLVENVFVCHKI